MCRHRSTGMPILNFDPLLGTGNSITVTLEPGENTFWAIAGEFFGCADTAMVTVTATDFQPVVSDTTINVCADFPTPIFVGTNPDYTYEWAPLEGITYEDDQLIVNIIENQTYSITVTDPVSTCTSTFEVMINAIEEAGIMLPADTAVCFIGDYTLTATTDVIAPITWYDNPTFTPPAIGEGNTITVTLVEGENTFWAIAGETTGCADTASITITATDFQPGLENTMLNICANTPVPINPNGNPNYDYTWSPTDGLIFGDEWNPLVSINMDQIYNVTVTDPVSGCELITAVEVTVITPIIELTASDDITICDTVPVPLSATATGDGVTLSWYDDVTLTGPPIGAGDNIEVIPEYGENIYVVQAEDVNGCTDSLWIRVTAINMNSGIIPNLTICEGDEVPLNANGNPNLVYSWSPADLLEDPTAVNPTVVLTETTTFQVMIEDSTGFCQAKEMVEVTVLPTIGLEAEPDTAILCMLGEVDMTATSDADGVNFAWYTDLDADPIATGPNLTQSPTVDEVYYVVASYEGACAEIDSVVVLVSELNATITAPQLFCEPTESATLVVTNLEPTQTLTYSWSPALAIIGGTASDPMVEVDPNIASDFSVTITNEDGCTDVLTTTVTVIDLEGDLSISATPDTIFFGNESQLLVEGCDSCTYDWSPSDDLDADDVSDPVALPDEPGLQTYTVVVEDRGCVETLEVDLFVRGLFCTEEFIFLPDAFTPNGDGMNDVLFVRSNNVIEMELMIYNRWGERVFMTRDINVGWDGTYKGEALPPDVYGFYLWARCPGEEEYTKQGSVTLLR
jgi:gliding motility-associated-like protein